MPPNYDHFRKKHAELIGEDFIFLGWSAVKTKEVGDYIKHNSKWPDTNTGMGGKYVNKGKKWSGLYLSSIVERCFGYADHEAPKEFPFIFRVYLKRSDLKELEVCINSKFKCYLTAVFF